MVVKHTCKWSLTSIKIVKNYICDVCHKHVQRNSTVCGLANDVTQAFVGCKREIGGCRRGIVGCRRGVFRCSGCKQTFGQKASLLVHRRRHSESKPYVCERCNVKFVTRAGLVMHTAGHKLRNVQNNQLDPDEVTEPDHNQHQEQYKKSQICMAYKSQNIVRQFVKIEKGDHSKQVLLITNNSSGQDNSTAMMCDTVTDLDKINRVALSILPPESYFSKVDVQVDMSDHKFAPVQWLINDGNNVQNQQTPVINMTSPCINQVNKVSSDDTSDSRTIIDDCISNSWWIKKKVPDDGYKNPHMEHQPSTSCDEILNNDDWRPTVSNSITGENNPQSGESSVITSKLEPEQKENETAMDNSNVLDSKRGRRSCTQNETPQVKVSLTRMVTRSVRKKVLPKTECCSQVYSNQRTPEIMSTLDISVPTIKSKRKIAVPESTICDDINPSNKKRMITSGLEEDAYNIEADSDIKSLLKKEGVEKVLYFQCSMCPVKHLSEQDLANHEKLHFGKNIKLHQCHICKKMCNDSTKLEDHLRLHTGEKPFTCRICHKNFRMKACLKMHMLVHTKEKAYQCSICSKEFTYRNTMNRHLATHQVNELPGKNNSNDEKVKCDHCDKHFADRLSLQRHIKNARQCDVCSEMFCSFSDLIRHKNTNHVDAFSVSKLDGTYCQFCKKTFKSNYIFLIHMQKHMRKGMPITFPCPICSESFKSYDLLRVHRKTHTVKREKCITCPWPHCAKMLTSQTRLDSHLKRHNGETIYLCHRCGMHFTDCVFYMKHRRACYQRITTYDCGICGKELSGYSSLQRHIMSHTGKKPYQCEVCGSRFVDNGHLKRHKRVHVRKGELPPFENVSTSETVTVEPVECVSGDPQPHDYRDYAACIDIGNEQEVTYCVDEQNGILTSEQTLLQTELLRATEIVVKEIQ